LATWWRAIRRVGVAIDRWMASCKGAPKVRWWSIHPLHTSGPMPILPMAIHTRMLGSPRSPRHRRSHLSLPFSGRGVEGVSLSVRRGELVVVTGRIGSGKSTFLAGAAGAVAQAARRGFVECGVGERPIGLFSRRPRGGHTRPKSPRLLFGLTLRDNVLAGVPGKRR
jgi:ABC-type multidrug transport system fused ATPase/permease subunit